MEPRLPLLEAIAGVSRKSAGRYHTPGHKGRPWLATDALALELLGESVFRADLTELPGLDNLAEPSGVLLRSQQLCAEAYGTARTVFLTCGASCGVVAAILASCRPGRKVLVPRECHRSVLAGVVLAHAVPVFYPCHTSQEYDLPTGAIPQVIVDYLRSEPDVDALVITNPNYFGVHRDLRNVVEEARRRAVVVVVDEAHGAHLPFVQREMSAISWGAHIVIHSAHKTLGSLTQGAIAHFPEEEPSLVSRFLHFLSLLHTSSPSYPIMVSLEAAVAHLQQCGREHLRRLMEISVELKQRLSWFDGVKVFQESADAAGFWVDPLKLTLKWLRHQASRVERWLIESKGVWPELVCGQDMLFLLGIGDNRDSLELLWDSVSSAVTSLEPDPSLPALNWSALLTVVPPRAMLPAEAFWAEHETVPLEHAAGRVCAAPILLYPPGVPLLWPGELFSRELCEFLAEALVIGWNVLGVISTDDSHSVRVCRER